MKTLIVHISDLHLAVGQNFHQGRAKSISDAALSYAMDIDEVHIVVSGDIANWGLPEEFELARTFLSELRSAIQDRTGTTPFFVIAPGNHDCDFSGDQSVRDMLLHGARQNPAGLSDAISEQLAIVQRSFRELQAEFCPSAIRHSHWVTTVVSDSGVPIQYVVFNSALLSIKKEVIGKLHVPVPSAELDSEGQRKIFVMHHPYNWLDPDNARELAQYVSRCGDLFFMGHEHELWATQVTELYDETSITYFKGNVLFDPDQPAASAFQTVIVDELVGFKFQSFAWNGNNYLFDERRSGAEYLPWPESSSRIKLTLSRDGYCQLTSPGANFSHRRKDSITLPDIYVWPNLKKITPERDTGNTFTDALHFDAELLVSEYRSLAPVVVVKGAEQFGKSALGRMTALQLSKRGLHPLLLSATGLASWREKSLNERIDQAIDLFYGKRRRDEYRQQPADRKVLVIDEFDLSQVSKGYFEGLRALRAHFGKIFLMLDSHPGMDIALSEFLKDESFADSDIFELLSSNYHNRLQLIEKWLWIGTDHEEKEEIRVTAARLSKVVDETLGRNLIPAVPIFVLIVLQQAELTQDLNTVVKSGSHGFLYESMIQHALTAKVTACSTITALTYLAAFASTISAKQTDHLTQVDYERFHVEHCRTYALQIPLSALQQQLQSAELIENRDGLVRFKYPFHFYYFIARWLARSGDWATVDDHVEKHILTLHTERSANTLLFLAHLTGDHRIADRLLSHASGLFSEYAELDLFARPALFDKFSLPDIRQILFEGSRALQLENHQSDEQDADAHVASVARAAETRFAARLRDALAMNEAFKAMQVLGQVLRNHAGEIERETKQRIAETCVGLGFRMLTFMLETATEHGEDLLAFRGGQIKAERPTTTDFEVAEELEQYLPGLVASIVMGTAIKMANAIGAEDLEPTIKSVLGSGKSRALLALVTKLEHFSEFPESEILAFKKNLVTGSDYLPLTVLRRFVVRRFYLFPSRDELRRSVCEKFGIRALPFSFMEQRKLGASS